MKILAILICSQLLVFSGCSKVKPSEIIGSYLGVPPSFGELLVEATGLYTYTFNNDGEVVTRSGKWEVDDPDDLTISFSGFTWPHTFSRQPEGIWIVTPEKKLKGVVFIIDEDQGAYFIKQ